MEELDLLKKAWQKDEHSFSQVSEVEIYKMLHKKSSSIVKWILIISILEVLLWTSFSVLVNTDDYLKSMHSEELIIYFKFLNYFSYAIILGFIYCFYKNYVKISTTESTKNLMRDILRTRKTVQYYVWYNLGMITLSMFLGFALAFFYNPEMNALKEKIAHENGNITLIITICILLLTTIIIVGVFWLFYKLLYGILLKKLNNNYKELKKIDL
jgi:heme/copper-type cytochrome/quinol oxidase subunit 2